MDKINVQKSTCRITFVQNRAALGNLRNFFGGIFVRAYMVRGHAHPLKPNYTGRCQKGAKRRKRVHACPFFGHPCFQKKGFRVFGTVFGGFACVHIPFLGILVFRKKVFAFWGLSSAALGHGHVPFWCILVFRKKLFQFLGGCLRRL